MKRVNLIYAVTVFLLIAQSISAKVKLPAIVSSNMVLQRNTTIELWGWADANEKISIKTSWLKELLLVEADEEGNWQVEAKTTSSKEPQTISIKSKTSNITLENVVFGEVWLCSGQSNMEQPMGGYYAQPTFNSNRAIAMSNNPNLRLFTINKVGARNPLKDIEKFTAWQQASPESVADFSAIGYFFGKQLQEILDVPVGIIHSSWGGSFVEAWMSKEVLSEYQEIDIEDANLERSSNVQTALFNAMINPLIPFTIKGALWYQGESNCKQPKQYKELFPAMVKDWRTHWGIGDFPFYYTQIAPFNYSDCNSALIREAQLHCLDSIPNSGIAITMDIGREYFIHPPQKKEVADRLLYNALNQTYNYKSVDYAGPMYTSHEVEDEGIVLSFENIESGLYWDELDGFEIAGQDKVFYPADAKVTEGKYVVVKSDRVLNPVAVRYAWRNWIVGTLYDTNMLPASSFRTDNWDNATKSEKKYNKDEIATLDSLFSTAMQEAENPTPEKINYNLRPIVGNPNLIDTLINGELYVKMVSWKSDSTLIQDLGKYNTGNDDIWVTAAPIIKERCIGYYKNLNDPVMRLRQLLGLQPFTDETFFLEVWVRPIDLFRPCPDNGTEDTSCDLNMPETVTSEYRKWFNNLRAVQYKDCSDTTFHEYGYPWTQLGYTYDWSPDNPSHVGLSEFLITRNTEVYVRGQYGTEKYCTIDN